MSKSKNNSIHLFVLALVLSSNVIAEEKPILIKSVRSFQLNPINENDNTKGFNYQNMMTDCFNSSPRFKKEIVNQKVVINIINQKIKTSSKIPTISCSELIADYKEKIDQ